MADDATGSSTALSIQGEAQQETGRVRASDEDVDLYVDGVSDEVLACRERGRHLFPTIRQAGIHFHGVDREGMLLRRLVCTCCLLAVKVEKWEGVRAGSRTRFRRVASNLEYRTGNDGEVYLAPSGRGHMTPRQIGDSVASKALAGQSVTALRKAATKAAAEAAAEKAAADKAAAEKAAAKPVAEPATAKPATAKPAAAKPAAAKTAAKPAAKAAAKPRSTRVRSAKGTG
ncbi:hypothetical protein [Pseudonocardia sp. N23]|uniref:hypothetical protein n=1 Tax=Pseudonocardia sp. N23 TaxID=1987376 RepID=UPI000C023E78|nr:hypothetical protein [Pseudonocardia sp. N23]GAY07135.1 transcriptional regulatory protein algP [Pseudonocardia sp. N23]